MLVALEGIAKEAGSEGKKKKLIPARIYHTSSHDNQIPTILEAPKDEEKAEVGLKEFNSCMDIP